MSEQLETDFDKLKKILDQFPDPEPEKTPTFTCQISGKEIEEGDIIEHNTGVAVVKEYLHPDYIKDVKDLAKVACIGCAKVVAYLNAGLDKDGFLLEPGKIYHIVDCPSCNPAKFAGTVVETPLVEKQIYLKNK